jgi:hypothetical protein
MTDKKYCEDCRWFREAQGQTKEYRLTLARCAHPKSAQSALRYVARSLNVGGYADLTRGTEYLCGPVGAWFEPVEVSNEQV